MKRGFTLIELLSVIIILSIISFFVIIKVGEVVNEAKMSANLSQSYLILNGAENLYASSYLSNDEDLKLKFNGITDVYENIKTSSSKPENGMTMIDNSGNVSLAINIDNYCYTKRYDESKIHVTMIADDVKCYIDTNGIPTIGLTYEKLDYIYSDGEQYFDTGLMNTGNYIIEEEVYLETANDQYMSWLFGGRTDFAYGYGVLVQKLSNGVMEVFALHGGSSVPIRISNSIFDKWITVSFSKDNIVIDGNNYTTSGGIIVPSDYEQEIRLGGMSQTMGTDNRNFVGMKKGTVITDATTGVVVRNFIPVKINETGEIGFWDLEHGQFYSNDGEGEFEPS